MNHCPQFDPCIAVTNNKGQEASNTHAGQMEKGSVFNKRASTQYCFVAYDAKHAEANAQMLHDIME